MTLKECTAYCWSPPDEPFDGEEGSIWSLNYFFFNKERKRVTYLYVRGVPQTPRFRIGSLTKRSASGYDSGANKRAKFWLGDQAANVTNDEVDTEMWNEDDDTDNYGDAYDDNYDDEADDESDDQSYKGPVRGVSEDIAARMELDY